MKKISTTQKIFTEFVISVTSVTRKEKHQRTVEPGEYKKIGIKVFLFLYQYKKWWLS